MACTYDDGYEDARSRRGRDFCDCDDYTEGYRAGMRINEREREAREEYEQQEYEAYRESCRAEEERRAYEEEMLAQHEAEHAELTALRVSDEAAK